ncbi:hypothetical protein X798_03723 [Onchocerca flexuosa]|uniref:Uncharacterized protein n=1 Tax=Onchocerca flexuosa TaxID=387005 RepID=A0A238BV09_9BILA|nr:hypothetical protein X798_03723 [Onchocerca flexuosa]
MGVNSLSLLVMIISYAIIIYKVRESSQAIAKHQLIIEDNRLENNIDLDLRSNNFRSTRGQISRKELRLFIRLRHEISRLLCNSSTKTVPPTHRGYLLTSNKLFKYTTKNQSARISGSSNQHDGRCEASATQSEHNLLTIKISDTINNININKAAVNSAAALVTMTMTNDIDTVDNNDVTNVTVVFKKTHRHLFVDNNIIIIGKNDTCDI